MAANVAAVEAIEALSDYASTIDAAIIADAVDIVPSATA